MSNDEPSVDPTVLARKIMLLEERNRLLLAENASLHESLRVFHRKSMKGGVHDGIEETKVSQEDTNDIHVTTNLEIESLMTETMNSMVELTKKCFLSKRVTNNPDESKGEEDGQERVHDSLRHVFVDTLATLGEMVINPEGFSATHAKQVEKERRQLLLLEEDELYGESSKSEEENDYSEDDEDNDNNTSLYSHLYSIRHPMTWLFEKFPVPVYKQTYNDGNEGSNKDDDPRNTTLTTSSNVTVNDWFPLHWCVLSQSCDVYDIDVLCDHYHKSNIDNTDMPPLILAVAKPSVDMNVVEMLLEKSMNSISSKSIYDGSFPLHHALAYNNSMECIEQLHSLYPKAALESDLYGFKAINYAASYGTNRSVQFLLHRYPKCTYHICQNGASALHHAAAATIDTYPFNAIMNWRTVQGDNMEGEAEREAEEDPVTMINQCILDKVSEIFHSNPDLIKTTDEAGAFPLHIAAKKGSFATVEFLYRMYPEALLKPDKEGLLPMHYASSREDKDINLEVVQYILGLM